MLTEEQMVKNNLFEIKWRNEAFVPKVYIIDWVLQLGKSSNPVPKKGFTTKKKSVCIYIYIFVRDS